MNRAAMVRQFMLEKLNNQPALLTSVKSTKCSFSTNYLLNKAQVMLWELAKQFYEEADEDDEDISQRAHGFAMLLEELSELAEGLWQRHEVKTFDALTDIAYLVEGRAVKWDLPIEEGFIEVHESNMTKDARANKIGADRAQGSGKGKNYRPPNLKRVLEEHRNKGA